MNNSQQPITCTDILPESNVLSQLTFDNNTTMINVNKLILSDYIIKRVTHRTTTAEIVGRSEHQEFTGLFVDSFLWTVQQLLPHSGQWQQGIPWQSVLAWSNENRQTAHHVADSVFPPLMASRNSHYCAQGQSSSPKLVEKFL